MGKHPGLYSIGYLFTAGLLVLMDGNPWMIAFGLVLGGMGLGAEIEKRS